MNICSFGLVISTLLVSARRLKLPILKERYTTLDNLVNTNSSRKEIFWDEKHQTLLFNSEKVGIIQLKTCILFFCTKLNCTANLLHGYRSSVIISRPFSHRAVHVVQAKLELVLLMPVVSPGRRVFAAVCDSIHEGQVDYITQYLTQNSLHLLLFLSVKIQGHSKNIKPTNV